MENILRPFAEITFKEELDALKKQDSGSRPPSWHLSPESVVQYIMGGKSGKTNISPKYIGHRRLIEIAVATLATDRALLLSGVPGTAKTWISEHLSAAISGDSTLLIQGTAGIMEESIRYGWNYALLISKGPGMGALVPSPVMKAMEQGKMVRIEELSRIPSEVQDALITLLSEKIIPIPELNTSVQAISGFNLIATANSRDKGIHEMSSALRRRFNTVVMPLPATIEEEINIIQFRVSELSHLWATVSEQKALHTIEQLVVIFRELRQGLSIDGQIKIKSPQSTLSTAEAISVMINTLTLQSFFSAGKENPHDLAASMSGAILKDTEKDLPVWKEYLDKVMRKRPEYKKLYSACMDLIQQY